MLHIVKLNGTEKELYTIVAPLVMDPAVLKYNHNYPFKTGDKYQWYVALDGKDNVVGFIPVENKRTGSVLNNYYAHEEGHDDILTELLKAIAGDEDYQDATLYAVVQTPHAEVFARQGFTPKKIWKQYVKMQRTSKSGQTHE